MIDLHIADPLILPLVPAAERDGVVALWQLDARLAEVARTGREAALRQIRMRWWAEAIGLLGVRGAPAGEPLLGAFAASAPSLLGVEQLHLWTDAWEQIVVDPVSIGAARDRGRALFGLTAGLLGMTSPTCSAGELWSLVERAGGGDDARARAALLGAARATARATGRAGRIAKPLAALDAVARLRARHHGVVHWRREQLVVLRVGLLGR